MKIQALIVIDEDGVEHRWEGEGSVMVRSNSYKTDEYRKDVNATLFLPSDGRINA